MAFKTEGRIYTTPVGRLWSVTTLLGIIDKSGPLTYWAAKQAVLYVEQELEKAYVTYPASYEIPVRDMRRILDAAKKEFRNAKEKAANRGKEVHKLIEEWVRQGYKGTDDLEEDFPKASNGEIANSFQLFLNWAREAELEPLESERVIYHPNQEFAGTADLIARGKFNKKWRKSRIYLLDMKTSKDFYETFGPQISAYTEGYRNTPKSKHQIDGMGIIRIGVEDGKPEFRDYTEHHSLNYMRFLAAKEAYILWKGRPE